MGVRPQRPARRSAAWQPLLDALADAAWLVDAATLRLLAINPAARALLRLDAATLRVVRADRLIATPEDLAFWERVRAGDFGELDSRTVAVDAAGRALPVTRRIRRVDTADTGPVLYLVTVHDRSADQREADEREEALAELSATLESTADGILVTDLAGRIRSFNQRFARIWELPDEPLAERDDAAVWDWMRNRVADPGRYRQRVDAIAQAPLQQATDLLTLRSGQVLERVTQPQWRLGQPCGRVWVFRDRTALFVAGCRIEAPGTTDALTGLINRRRLIEVLAQALERARRDHRPLAVLLIDLDRFGQINRSLGDGVGDQVLVATAQRLREGLRPDDQLARVGGDRFALVLPDTDGRGAESAARRALDAVAAPSAAGALRFTLSASIGIGLCPADGVEADAILRHAEAALGRARSAGRAGFRFCQPRHEIELRRRTALDQAMRAALASQRLRLQFQPQVDSASGAIAGAQALVRWRDPELGDVSAAEFGQVAEETGFVVALGDWVLAQAAGQCARWRASGIAVPLSVKVAAAQFDRDDFVERVAGTLRDHELPGALLELELAGSIAAGDADDLLPRLERLAALGVRLALDDFGAGAVSLAGFKRLPVGRLKIGRGIVAGVPGDPGDAAIVRATAQLARGFGIGVVADGVETRAQHEFLRAAGCDAFQGELFAPPLDPLSFVERWRGPCHAPRAAIAPAVAAL